MATEDDDVELEGIILSTSPKAVRFQADTWDSPEWLPRSQITVVPDRDSDRQGKATVYVKRWLAKKNGWVEE